MDSSVAGMTTRYYYYYYYYDDQRVILETEDSGSGFGDARYYIWGNYIDELLVMRKLTETASDYYYAHDHLYSTVALFDSSGAVAERYEYDAYGAVHIMDASYNNRSASSYGNSCLFTGRTLDTLDNGSLKIMYYRARYYTPATGRFLQRDPLGVDPAGGEQNRYAPINQFTDGMNFYEYAKSMPVIKTDAWGLESDGQACCKIKEKTLVAGGGAFAIVEGCRQETIPNPGGYKPGYACRCHYKGRKNVHVYDWHKGKCEWCDVWLLRENFPSSKQSVPFHYGVGVICEKGLQYSVDVGPSGDTRKGWPNDEYPNELFVQENISSSWEKVQLLGRISKKNADDYLTTFKEAQNAKDIPINWSGIFNCHKWAIAIGNFMFDSCP